MIDFKKLKPYLWEAIWLVLLAVAMAVVWAIYNQQLSTRIWTKVSPYLPSDSWRSVDAQSAFFWSALVCALLLILFLGRRQLDILRDVSPNALQEAIGGFEPQLPDSIRKRIWRLRFYALRIIALTLYRAVILVVVAALLPALLLYSTIERQCWLFADSNPALIIRESSSVETVRPEDISEFLIDQSIKGAANDIAEVFDLDYAAARNNPSNLPFSIMVVIYRFLTSTAAVALLYIAWRLFRSSLKLGGRIRYFKDKLARALNA